MTMVALISYQTVHFNMTMLLIVPSGTVRAIPLYNQEEEIPIFHSSGTLVQCGTGRTT